MSYTPTTWTTGDTITPSALNKIEQGIADGGGGVIITDNGTALDKTYAEIYDLVNSGTPCFIKYNAQASQTDLDADYAYSVKSLCVNCVFKYDDAYRVYASTITTVAVSNTYNLGANCAWVYAASTSTDYPTFSHTVYTNESNLVKQTVRR